MRNFLSLWHLIWLQLQKWFRWCNVYQSQLCCALWSSSPSRRRPEIQARSSMTSTASPMRSAIFKTSRTDINSLGQGETFHLDCFVAAFLPLSALSIYYQCFISCNFHFISTHAHNFSFPQTNFSSPPHSRNFSFSLIETWVFTSIWWWNAGTALAPHE